MNKIVANQIQRVYDKSPCSWSLEECFAVFEYYFETYQARIGCSHPHMKTETVQRIIDSLDEVEDAFGRTYDLMPEEYPCIIDSYFDEVFGENCNYSMAHFMAGDIRINRCFTLGFL